MSEPFIAEIKIFAGNFAPRGYALCDGQLLPISSNSALFSLVGTIYGGDGRTTFGLPRMRGRTPIHAGSGAGLSPRQLGSLGGAETTIQTVSTMANHNHSASSTSTMMAFDGGGNETAAEDGTLANGNNYNTGAPDVNMHAGSVGTTTTVNANGGGQPMNNMQPFIAVNYIIALTGIFPSRN